MLGVADLRDGGENRRSFDFVPVGHFAQDDGVFFEDEDFSSGGGMPSLGG
jgi:hypothetical protein